MSKKNKKQAKGIKPQETVIPELSMPVMLFVLEVIKANPKSATAMENVLSWYKEEDHLVVTKFITSFITAQENIRGKFFVEHCEDAHCLPLMAAGLFIRYQLGLEQLDIENED